MRRIHPAEHTEQSRFAVPGGSSGREQHRLPGTGYVEIGRAVHSATSEQSQCVLEHLEFHKALVIDKSTPPRLRVSYDHTTGNYTVHSRQGDAGAWSLHAQGRISSIPGRAGARPIV